MKHVQWHVGTNHVMDVYNMKYTLSSSDYPFQRVNSAQKLEFRTLIFNKHVIKFMLNSALAFNYYLNSKL